MDVLLVRQYDLLRCLDANRTKRSDDDLDTVNGSRRAMMGTCAKVWAAVGFRWMTLRVRW